MNSLVSYLSLLRDGSYAAIAAAVLALIVLVLLISALASLSALRRQVKIMKAEQDRWHTWAAEALKGPDRQA